MKVKVISIFRDKYTNKVYKKNKRLDIDEKRYSEVKDYVKLINNTKKEKNYDRENKSC